MKKVTIKYATERVWSDAIEGSDWLKNKTDLHKHDYKLFNDVDKLNLDSVKQNWSTVQTTYFVHSKDNAEILNSIFHDLNHISTEDLKNSNGFNAEFRQDQDNDDLDRMIKLNNLQEKYPEADDRKLRSIWCSHMIAHTSMSVGDIVIIESRDQIIYYMCDRMGWTELKVIEKNVDLVISRNEAMQIHKLIHELHSNNSMPVSVFNIVDRLKDEAEFDLSVHDELR